MICWVMKERNSRNLRKSLFNVSSHQYLPSSKAHFFPGLESSSAAFRFCTLVDFSCKTDCRRSSSCLCCLVWVAYRRDERVMASSLIPLKFLANSFPTSNLAFAGCAQRSFVLCLSAIPLVIIAV